MVVGKGFEIDALSCAQVEGCGESFIVCWLKIGVMWLWLNGQQDLAGDSRLLCISRVEARPGDQRHMAGLK